MTHKNKWMINKSNYVISYVIRTVGGASKFKQIALKQGKSVINIANSIMSK